MSIFSRAGLPVSPDQITPESVFLERREMLQALGYVGISSLLPGFAIAASPYEVASDRSDVPAWLKQKIRGRKTGLNNTGETLTPYDSVTTYNNFYEFGLDKEDPSEKSSEFRPDPWKVSIEGLCAKPGSYALEDILRPHADRKSVV